MNKFNIYKTGVRSFLFDTSIIREKIVLKFPFTLKLPHQRGESRREQTKPSGIRGWPLSDPPRGSTKEDSLKLIAHEFT